MSVSLVSHKCLDKQQLTHSLLLGQPVTVPTVCILFSPDPLLFQWTCTALPVMLCHSAWHVDCLHSPSHLFISFHLSLQAQCQFWRLPQLQQSLVPLQFSLPDVDIIIITEAIPNYWAFHFQGSCFPFSCNGTWSRYMGKVHIGLQELKAFELRLCKMAF